MFFFTSIHSYTQRSTSFKFSSHLGAEREHELYQRTGAPLHASYALPQLRELYSKTEYADIVSQIVIWQTLSSTCLTRWRGTPFSHVSYSEASWTGLFNFRTFEWDKEAVSLLPEECKNHMPPLCDYSDEVMPSGGMREHIRGANGMKRNPYFDRWPELRGPYEGNTSGCRLYFGLGDGACANIGSKCSTNQKIAVTIGTTAAARVCIPIRPSACVDNFHVPEGLFCYRLDRSHVLVGGALTDGGSVVEWARELLSLQDDTVFANCMAEVEQLLNEEYETCIQGNHPPSAVSLIPFLSGERSTGFREGASFCLAGLTRNSKSAHFMKACLEGVTLRLQAILRLLRVGMEDGRRQPRIVASGSALNKNALWRQMLADCSGLQVQLDTTIQESTSMGVATMIAVALAMERDMATESTAYLTHEQNSQSIYSSPRQPITQTYWMMALEDQESLIDVVSSLW
jgi:gluconokinase